MCAAFSSVALATVAIGTAALSATGAIMQGQSQKSAEEYNAQVARQEAQALRVSTDFEIERRREEQKKLVSRQRALYGKAGVRFSGSPLTVMIDTIASSEMDSAVLDYNAKVGISQKTSEAKYRRQVGRGYMAEGWVKAGTTLLSTATELGYQKWGK